MSYNPDDKNVRYFATGNIISPFVAVFGDWSNKSALIRNSVINGVKLGKRPMIECEIEANNRSTRSMFMYWPSIHSMLWTHRGPDLIHFYPALINNIRRQRYFIKAKALLIDKKRAVKAAQGVITAEIITQNKIVTPTPVVPSNDDFNDLIQAIGSYKYEFEYKLINE